MISSSLFISLLFFSVAAAFTPGPNNIMLTASGANFGFRRTIPHMLGVTGGFTLLLLSVAFGLGVLFTTYPLLQTILKVCGSTYLFYFAWRIATSRRSGSGGDSARPFTFLQASGFQFVNPKAWMMAISALAAFTLSGEGYTGSAFTVMLVFVVVTVAAVATWSAFGTVIGRLLKSDRAFRVFNISMAILTASSVVLLFTQ